MEVNTSSIVVGGLVIVLLLLIVIIIQFSRGSRKSKEMLEDAGTNLTFLSLRPNLWWFVDDEINARNWWDFGARNSKQPNRGYLQIALDVVKKTQGVDFSIHPLIGRDQVTAVLRAAGAKVPKEVNALPATLWRQWAIANLAAYKGGLVMVGDSTLCVGPSFGPVTKNYSAAVFGIFPEEIRANAYDVPGSVQPPAPWVAWANGPNQTAWMTAASEWTRLVGAGPTGWTAAEIRKKSLSIWTLQVVKDISHIPEADGGRRLDGYERNLEDLLGRVTDSEDEIQTLPSSVLYVPMDGDRLVRSAEYAWFVRMSPQQILESPFAWATIAKKALTA